MLRTRRRDTQTDLHTTRSVQGDERRALKSRSITFFTVWSFCSVSFRFSRLDDGASPLLRAVVLAELLVRRAARQKLVQRLLDAADDVAHEVDSVLRGDDASPPTSATRAPGSVKCSRPVKNLGVDSRTKCPSMPFSLTRLGDAVLNLTGVPFALVERVDQLLDLFTEKWVNRGCLDRRARIASPYASSSA